MESESCRRSATVRSCVEHVDELRLDASACPVQCKSVVLKAVRSGGLARRGATRSRGAVIGTFPSFKMGTTFSNESSVEASVLVLADVLEEVLAFRPQALRVVFVHRGRPTSAYPDLAVLRVDGGCELWECKPDRGVGEETFERLVALRASLRAVGIPYLVRQPRWSRRAPWGRNAALIWRHADQVLPPTMPAAVEKAVRCGTATLGALGQQAGATFPMLLALAARGTFAVDIGGAPLGAGSSIRQAAVGATSGAFDATADVQGV